MVCHVILQCIATMEHLDTIRTLEFVISTRKSDITRVHLKQQKVKMNGLHTVLLTGLGAHFKVLL